MSYARYGWITFLHNLTISSPNVKLFCYFSEFSKTQGWKALCLRNWPAGIVALFSVFNPHLFGHFTKLKMGESRFSFLFQMQKCFGWHLFHHIFFFIFGERSLYLERGMLFYRNSHRGILILIFSVLNYVWLQEN